MEQAKSETRRIPKMRTAKGILAELQERDPKTAITLSFIRRIINSGQLPVVQAGKKKLVNMDLFLALLESSGEAPAAESPSQKVNPALRGIRRVEE